MQQISSYNQLKEENFILSEKLSQFEEGGLASTKSEISSKANNSESELASVKTNLASAEQEIRRLKAELQIWRQDSITEDVEVRLKVLVKDWERKFAVKDVEHSQEIDNLREQLEAELYQVQEENRTVVKKFREELKDK